MSDWETLDIMGHDLKPKMINGEMRLHHFLPQSLERGQEMEPTQRRKSPSSCSGLSQDFSLLNPNVWKMSTSLEMFL